MDSGGGFLIEKPLLQNESNANDLDALIAQVPDDALQIPVSYLKCMDCSKDFVESYLMTNFEYSVGTSGWSVESV